VAKLKCPLFPDLAHGALNWEAAMDKAGTITMTMREVDRLKTIQAVIDGMLTALMAADRLGLTKRQVNRFVIRYRLEGAAGLVSRQRGQPGHLQLAPGIAVQALGSIRDQYDDSGPTFACEKLREGHGLLLLKETIRKRRMGTSGNTWKSMNIRMVASNLGPMEPPFPTRFTTAYRKFIGTR
jgi:hypothetical protein